MTDIVEWLRKEAELVALDRLTEAADELERHMREKVALAALVSKERDEIARLRAVLRRRGDALLSIAIGGNGEHNWTLDEVRAVARDAVEFLPPSMRPA